MSHGLAGFAWLFGCLLNTAAPEESTPARSFASETNDEALLRRLVKGAGL